MFVYLYFYIYIQFYVIGACNTKTSLHKVINAKNYIFNSIATQLVTWAMYNSVTSSLQGIK